MIMTRYQGIVRSFAVKTLCMYSQYTRLGEEGGDKSKKGKAGIEPLEVGMLASLGEPDNKGIRSWRLYGLIPLEELTTGAIVVDMGSLGKFEIILKFDFRLGVDHILMYELEAI